MRIDGAGPSVRKPRRARRGVTRMAERPTSVREAASEEPSTAEASPPGLADVFFFCAATLARRPPMEEILDEMAIALLRETRGQCRAR